MSSAILFKGVWVQPGSKGMELLEAKPPKTKEAEKLLRALTKMEESGYDASVVQQIRNENPDLF